MIQQRKKDYLQRLIEDFFSKVSELKGKDLKNEDLKVVLSNAFKSFFESFGVKQSDDTKTLIHKIDDIALVEQYAKLLFFKYEIVDIKEKEQLETALDIIKYIEAIDKTYSWDRVTLREDLLRLLDEQDTQN